MWASDQIRRKIVSADGGCMTMGIVRKSLLYVIALLFLLKVNSWCQTFQLLYAFDGRFAGDPVFASLVEGPDGSLYGTTAAGGDQYTDQGTFFRITQAGVFTRLYVFCSLPNCSDGKSPWAGVILGVDGNFYGSTTQGGTNNTGTIFKITPGGQLTTLYNFGSNDGNYHSAPLVQAVSGDLYGTMAPAPGDNGPGSIYKITPGGSFTTVYTFCHLPGCVDGSNPYDGLIQATDGNLYGTTEKGGGGEGCGNEGCGTVFKMSPGGKLTTIYRFNRPSGNGLGPESALLQANDGKFYGTTIDGGVGNLGTAFRINARGSLRTLHSFCPQGGDDCPDGLLPFAGLVQGTDGNLYGTKRGGDAYFNYGTVFQIAGTGKLTTQFGK